MDITSLEMSKKLKRYGLVQGKSEYFYQKESNCTVYHLSHKGSMRMFSFDALHWYQITQKSIDLGFSQNEIQQVREQDTADKQAEILISICISKNIRLYYVPPKIVVEQGELFI